MDRPIATNHLRKKKQAQYLQWGLGIAFTVSLVYILTQWLTPSIERQMLRTDRVTVGSIESTINASGVIVPEFEQTVTSPIDTRLLKVLRRAGDSLRGGEPILLLDLDYVRISIRKNNDQLALKSNALAQLKATYESKLIELRSNLQNKKLDAKYKETEYQQHEQLLAKKVVAKNEFLQKKMAYEQVKNEVAQMEASLENLEASTKLQEEGLRLEVNILKSELELLEQQLAQGSTASQRSGVLTWVLNTEGASIRKGETLAKIADLSTYKLEAKVSDIHAANIFTGMPVKAKLARSGQDAYMEGEVANIRPTVENGVMEVQVRLKDTQKQQLRPNLRVDVYLIKEYREHTKMVRTPSFASEKGKTEVFVMRGDKAVKRLVEVGVRSSEHVEILSGLEEGDEVILSDMSEYKHLSEVKLN